MKKILALIFVLFLVAGCNSGTTGQLVKDVTQDNTANQNKLTVLPSVTEICDLEGKSLSCSSAKTTSDGNIKIKLTNVRYGIASLKKVSLLGLGDCSESFSGEVKDGMNYRESQEITLKCNFDEPYIKTPIRIEYRRYEPSQSNGPQLAPYTEWNEEVEGELVSIVY